MENKLNKINQPKTETFEEKVENTTNEIYNDITTRLKGKDFQETLNDASGNMEGAIKGALGFQKDANDGIWAQLVLDQMKETGKDMDTVIKDFQKKDAIGKEFVENLKKDADLNSIVEQGLTFQDIMNQITVNLSNRDQTLEIIQIIKEQGDYSDNKIVSEIPRSEFKNAVTLFYNSLE